MSYRLLLPFALLCLLALEATAQSPTFHLPSQNPLVRGKQGRIVVKVSREWFRKGVTPRMFGEVAARYGIYNVEPWLNPGLVAFRLPAYKRSGTDAYESQAQGLGRIMVVEYSSLDAPEDVVIAMERFAGIEYAELIYPRQLLQTPNDPRLSDQWYLDSIHARQAWDNVRGSDDIIVAITDSGIEREHEDLRDAIWKNPGETGLDDQNRDKTTNGVDDDNNGYVDDWWGYDFAANGGTSKDNDPSPDANNHGTVVAGIIGATGDNDKGIAGIAYGVKLMAIKIVDNGEFAREMEGVLYAAKMGARVINCSWGGRASSRAEQEVIDVVINDHNAVVVGATGNNNEEVDFYPSSYHGVISVAAIAQWNAKANFSNYGSRIDISAPGHPIFSTTFSWAGSYTIDPTGGTSFATPMASAAAALIVKKFPNLRPRQVGEIIRATADDIRTALGPIYADKMGTGRLNIQRAVESGMSQIAARMMSYEFIDTDKNGAIDPGENIRLRIGVQNMLASAPDVEVTVTPVSHPSLVIQNSTVNMGPMTTLERQETGVNDMLFTVPAGTPENTDMRFRVEVTAGGRRAVEYIDIRVVPTFLTTDLNDITATFNSTGNIGYNGIRSNSIYRGDGFVYDGNDRIYHGGLIIATDASHVADVVRRGLVSDGIEDGFRTTRPYRLTTSEDLSVQTGNARFNDEHLSLEKRVGVDVEMKTYEYRAAPGIVIVSYKIRNTGNSTINGMRAGLYLDWDVGDSGFEDQVSYEAEERMAYMRTPQEPLRGYIGTMLLTSQEPSFYGVDNDVDGVTTAFTPATKWRMLSSGIVQNSRIADMGMLMGAGTITLELNQEVEVAFALMAAKDMQALRETAARARQVFQQAGVVAMPTAGTLHSIAAPNPFSDGTALSFTMPRTGHAHITLYDMSGRAIATIFDGQLGAGTQQIPFAPEALPTGAYIYEIRTADIIERGKVVKEDN